MIRLALLAFLLATPVAAQPAGGTLRLLAHTAADNVPAQQVLLRNAFEAAGTDAEGRLRFEHAVEPAAPAAQ